MLCSPSITEESTLRQDDFAPLIGASVQAIYWSESTVVFETDRGQVAYTVEGDCCSSSYFHDFYGVEHLLANGPVEDFCSFELGPGDAGYRAETWEQGVAKQMDEAVVEVYGYRLTTMHPEYGPVTSILSFRNASNGYYGGWMSLVKYPLDTAGRQRITSDVTGD
jgi:hypothetical protein